LTPEHEFEHDVKLDVETRDHQGVNAILEEKMTGHLQTGHGELTLTADIQHLTW
jgi:hypothetical protein